MAHLAKRSFTAPDEAIKNDKYRMSTVRIGGRSITMSTYMPGWQWSKDVKPSVGTKSCMRHHYGYALSGTLRVRADDGSELEYTSGDMIDIPPGHDGWVVGKEPMVLLDFGEPCSCS